MFFSQSGPARIAFHLAILCYAALLCACGAKNGSSELGTPSLVLPSDSGSKPLTPTEIAAFETTGQLDKHLPASIKTDVALQYKFFLRKGRTTMSRFSQRAEKFLGHAKKVFRSRGMPDELAYLAIVESGYRAGAKSPAGAAGAWQFMEPTGKKHGLDCDWWGDERLDPYEATEAAADYLKKLHSMFGDWPTAIAAYNAGEGKISRARQAAGVRDYYGIREKNHLLDEKTRLREETRQYVPRFMAVSKIMRNLPTLGFDSIDHEATPEVRRFVAKPGTDLIGLARACNMTREDFVSFNLHQNRPMTSTERQTYVYIPVGREKSAEAFLGSGKAAPYAGWSPTTVASSKDSWEKISKRSNVPVATLRQANPGLERLRAGNTVIVPRSVNMSARAVAALDAKGGKRQSAPSGKNSQPLLLAGKSSVHAKNNANSMPGARRHILQPNENLTTVARKYNVSVKDLQACNNLDSADKVRAGSVLLLPTRAVAASTRTVSMQGRR